jgi:subtilisin family serine protease
MHASLRFKGQRFPKFLAFLFLLGFLLTAVIAFAPGSNATRPTNTTTANTDDSSKAKRGRREFVPGEMLVRFKHNKALQGSVYLPVPDQRREGQAVIAQPDQVLVQIDRFEGSDLIDGLRLARTSAQDTWRAIAALKAREDVLYAEPNYIVHADLLPNDPDFVRLWGLRNTGQVPPAGTPGADIDAELAWNITTGGTGSVVAVIDTGVEVNHTDLQANIWTNPSPGSIPGISGDVHGYDFINNSGTIPAEQHATHVSGTIGAVGNNGIGVAGVNWTTRLMSLRFIDESINSGSTADAIRACNYVKQMKDLWVSSGGTQGANVRVTNNSWGGDSFTQSLLDAINSLNQSGILFVAAAGNSNTNNDVAPHYPSNYLAPNVMAITASTATDAQFYNFGPQTVLMAAPGIGIYSTVPFSAYASFSGTSMATPHVAGSAALLLAANPNLTVKQLRALLAYNGDVLASLQAKTITGRRLNVFRSLQALAENDTTPPGKVGNFLITSQNGRTFNLSWIASGDDGGGGSAALYDLSFIDQASGAVIPLKTVIPATTASSQSISVSIPYQHTSGTIRLREFDNVGNEGTPAQIQVSIDPLVADPYLMSLNSAASLSTGGVPLAFNCDDCFKSTSLPFSFPFFGQTYTSVKVSSNGNLYFEPPTAPGLDSASSAQGLSPFRMIAGMWDDLDLRTCFRADADVFVSQPVAGRVIFRWQGVQFFNAACAAADPSLLINFEIELNSDGSIKTRYGSGNIDVFPVVGIAGGDRDPYVQSSLTSETSPITLTNAQTGVFTPRAATALPTLQFDPVAPVSEGAGVASITVTRTGNTTNPSTVDFATYDGTAIQSRDYLITTGTLTFNSGQTSQSFTIPIVDDVYAESAETLTVALSNNIGCTLGSTNTTSLTITDNDGGGPSIPQRRFLAALNGAQETPPVTTSGNGMGLILLNTANTSALVGLQFSNLSSAETAAHIHTGAPGVAGGITFPLPTTNPVIDFSIAPTAGQVTDLKTGQQYINVHSTNFGGGEIRGQLLWNPSLEDVFFVRQHYLDFLNREADPGGLGFWLTQLHCPQGVTGDQADVQCFHDRTIGVSNAFYFSGEFQLTASFVFLAYRAAYGNTQPFPNPDSSNAVEASKLPEYDVFMSDRPRVLGGANLAQQQLAFTNQFVTRPEFTSKYGAGLNTAALFVDAVLANIQASDGVAFSAADRTALIGNYNNAGGGNAGRAMVVWHLSNDYWNTCPTAPPCVPGGFGTAIDNRAFIDANYNRFFALVLYFGYLRRNPEIGGFLFWQDKINQAPVRNVPKQNSLVCSFITSGEYQARFGPFVTFGNSLLFPRTNAECPP